MVTATPEPGNRDERHELRYRASRNGVVSHASAAAADRTTGGEADDDEEPPAALVAAAAEPRPYIRTTAGGEAEECPRCGGDHSWCQSVRDDEYGPAPAAPDSRWRVGQSWGIHVYQGEKGTPGDRPVATFHQPEDAARAVAAVNEQSVALDSDQLRPVHVLQAGILLEPLDGNDIPWGAYKATRDAIAQLIARDAERGEALERVLNTLDDINVGRVPVALQEAMDAGRRALDDQP